MKKVTTLDGISYNLSEQAIAALTFASSESETNSAFDMLAPHVPAQHRAEVSLVADEFLDYRPARVRRICAKISSLKNATRLWNWIDSQPDPEHLWEIMRHLVPWAFADSENVNSIRFTY